MGRVCHMTHVTYHVTYPVLVRLMKQKLGHMTRFPTLYVRIFVFFNRGYKMTTYLRSNSHVKVVISFNALTLLLFLTLLFFLLLTPDNG